MAKFHFFTDIDLLNLQLDTQAFGPVKGSETTQYRVTSLHSASSNPNAYAVCKGKVLVQPDIENENLVNIILKPLDQPFKGIVIKYIVYRSLKKEDFIDGIDALSGEIEIIKNGNIDSATDFIKSIWKEYKDLNNLADDTVEPFFAKWIGYSEDILLESKNLDDYFFKVSSEDGSLNAFELPVVETGLQLGHFNSNFGIEIVLNSGDFKEETSSTGLLLNVNYAKKKETIVDINNIPVNYIEKVYKESVLDFIDPSVIWGMLIENGDELLIHKARNVYNALDIIEEVLQKYYTKNNRYIYIENSLNRSYDFYDELSVLLEQNDDCNIKIGTSSQELIPKKFGANGWPLLIITEETDSLFIQLLNNIDTPILLASTGNISSTGEETFLHGNNLAGNDLFTKVVTLARPSVVKDGIRINVPSLYKLNYNGALIYLTDSENENNKIQAYDLDEIFFPVNVSGIFASDNTNIVQWGTSHKYSLINLKNIIAGEKTILATNSKITFDYILNNEQIQQRVIFESFVNNIANNDTSITSIITDSAGKYQFDYEVNNFYYPKYPNLLTTEIFDSGGEDLYGLKLIQENVSQFFLGITKEEYEQLTTIVQNNNLRNVKISLQDQKYDQYPNEKIDYNIYILALFAEDTNGVLKMYTPLEKIEIYTLDRLTYFSKAYAQSMPYLSENIEIENVKELELNEISE